MSSAEEEIVKAILKELNPKLGTDEFFEAVATCAAEYGIEDTLYTLAGMIEVMYDKLEPLYDFIEPDEEADEDSDTPLQKYLA